MVLLSRMRASNLQISQQLQPNLVAVFVGGTSGIGEYTLKAFAKHARSPRVYLVGRAQEAADRIISECKASNDSGTYTFIKSDVSLLKNVDIVCKQIKEKESSINLLVMSQGTLVFGTESEEGLHYAAALTHYSRLRFAVNLLPLIQHATGIRRVVNIFVGACEGRIDLSDIQGRKLPIYKARGHGASLITFGHEKLAQKAPNVSFVHMFPGFVKTGISRGTSGVLMGMVNLISGILAPFLAMDHAECGERHLFASTSARYPAKKREEGDSVALAEGMDEAMGTNGQVGSGVYTVNEQGESGGAKIVQVLDDMRKEGAVEKMWELTMDDFKKVTGSESI